MDEPPLIEFPCTYPIKVIVEVGPDVVKEIFDTVRRYDENISRDKLTEIPSKKGNFVSVRFNLWATGKPQLQALFEDLKKCKAVRMVL
jgi:putative lipoic acid-binding regulatory protein